MHIKNRAGVFLILFFLITKVAAVGFNFGQGAGIVVEDGGTFDLPEGMNLTDGYIKGDGGILNFDGPITCNNGTLTFKEGPYYSNITLDGIINGSSTLVLGNFESLIMDGSLVVQTPQITGTINAPSLMRGVGSVIDSGLITIQTGGALAINVTGSLGASINFQGDASHTDHAGDNTATLILEDDLTFARGFGPYSAPMDTPGINKILCFGNRISFGGGVQSNDPNFGQDSAFAIKGVHALSDASLDLTGSVVFDTGSSFAFIGDARINGNGHTFYLSPAVAPLRNGTYDVQLTDLTVSGSRMTDWMIESPGKWVCKNCTFLCDGQSVTVNGSVAQTTNIFNSSAVFTRGEITLNTDLTLEGTWLCTYPFDLVINLNGHTLDLAAGTLTTVDIASGIYLKNGRVINVSSSSFAINMNSGLHLENVDISLASDTRIGSGIVFIDGQTTISGPAGTAFIMDSSGVVIDAQPAVTHALLLIKKDSKLTLRDGVIYSHKNSGVDTITMVDSTSQLELIGATLRRPDIANSTPLVLTKGTIIVDQYSSFQPGTGGIQFGDGVNSANNVSLVIRSGAALRASRDVDNSVSGGALIYANK